MTELFYAVLKASFQGSIVILAVLLLRLALKRAPKSLFCLLWLLAGLRLALPFEIESKLSLQPQIQEPELSVQMEAPVQLPDFVAPEINMNVPEMPSDPVNPGDYEDVQDESYLYEEEDGSLSPITLGEIAAQIWLLGMGIMAVWSLFSYWKLKRRVQMACHTEKGCFECAGLDTAFVLGFLPPKIYLPAGLPEEERKFILDHEHTHIARGDHWCKLLGYLVLSMHWFNPLVWVGYSLLCRDIELACDERVVKSMSLSERKAYSAALLSCGGRTARIAACPVAFGESNPKKRILNVLNYKRPGFWITLAAVIAVVFVAVCLLTSPGKQSLLEFGDVADQEIHTICISSEHGLISVSDPDDIKKIEKLLKSITWENDTSAEQPGESGSYGILFNSLLAEKALYFSEDCSWVWAKGTQAYPVSDAGKLREYLDNLTEAVWNRDTFGEPFADINQPAQWLRGISENAVREAQIYVEQPTVQEGNSSTTTRTQGVLSARDFDALLDILNGLPERAIVYESTLRRQSFTSLRGSLVPHGGMTLTVYDDVNQLVMMLRLVKNDVVEFILIDELDKVEDGVTYLDHPKCWIVEDDTLLDFLKQMQAHPMIIYPIDFFGDHTSDAEEIQSAWNMDMTDAEFMELCRNAVAEIQSRETYHISETLVYYVNEQEDSRSHVAYWGDGANWARQSYISRTEETRTHLYYDGQLYNRVQKDEGDPVWSLLETDHDPRYGLTWLQLLQWDAQLVTFEYAEEVEGVLHVFATVHSTAQPLGWDDVHEYTVGFFFDKSGRLTNALMGALRDGIRVMSDMKIETTSADGVRIKLGQFAQQRPEDIIPDSGEDYLEKCRTALERYRAQGSWVMLIDRQFSGDAVLNDSSSQLWYVSGDDWVKQGIVSNADVISEHWDLKKDGREYSRVISTIHHPGNGEDSDTGWTDPDLRPSLTLPWPLEYVWDSTKIQFVEATTEGDSTLVTFVVQGSPREAIEVEEYQVTFWLYPGGEAWKIQLEYTESHQSIFNHEKHTDQVHIIATIALNAAAPEEAERMIHRCYAEALLHIHGICNDPACTDESHDHSGVNCTDADCTNSTHHHDDHHGEEHH